MKIIGAGFARTGTASTQAALERLGIGPSVNMRPLVSAPDRASRWRAAQAGEPVDWAEMMQGYEATVGWPGCSFWEPLMYAFPDSKLILTLRDPEEWYESFRDTLLPLWKVGENGGASNVAPPFRPYFELVRLIAESTFDDRLDDAEHCMAVFEQHNKTVMETVPADRLLVYVVTDGWQPLCGFLGVEVPEGEPFPHVNDRESFRRGRMLPPS